MDPTHSIKLSGEKLSFSASHAVVFVQPHRPGSLAVEPFHGHDFAVEAEITGPINELGMVINFLIAESVLRSTIDRFNHKVILPAEPVHFDYEHQGDQLRIISKVDSRSWSFPKIDVCFVEASNATTEAIADNLAKFYWKRLVEYNLVRPGDAHRLRITLKESAGFSATVEYQP